MARRARERAVRRSVAPRAAGCSRCHRLRSRSRRRTRSGPACRRGAVRRPSARRSCAARACGSGSSSSRFARVVELVAALERGDDLVVRHGVSLARGRLVEDSVAVIALPSPGRRSWIAGGLPEPRSVFDEELESSDPLGALLEVQVRDQEPGRAAVLGVERLAPVLVGDPRPAHRSRLPAEG